MKPEIFIKRYMPFAKRVEAKTGISAVAILAQAALESGWGVKAVGNMMFGVKDTDGINGNEQLITTTEFLNTKTVKFPKIISITWIARLKKYRYVVQDWFRKYESPEQSFLDHANFFLKNPRYKIAVAVGKNPKAFADAVAKAGYATDPNYANTMKAVIDSILKRM